MLACQHAHFEPAECEREGGLLLMILSAMLALTAQRGRAECECEGIALPRILSAMLAAISRCERAECEGEGECECEGCDGQAVRNWVALLT